MRVSAVHEHNCALNYRGSFFKEASFRELQNSLKGTEKDTFEHIVASIENAKDDYSWWFNTKTINNGTVKIATMGLLEKDGTPRKPGLFLVEAKDSLDIFKNLSRWYKNNVEGYKE